MSIDSKTSEFLALEPLIALSKALLGGTRTMRLAGETYLPKMQMEEKETYDKRLEVSVLYPAYAETIKQMVGRVFFKPIEVQNSGLDENLLNDLDRLGNDVSNFLIKPFADALSYSRAYVLVTAPDGSKAKTKADEQALNIRPYAVVVEPSQVLGIKREQGRITEFRYIAQHTQVDENYEEVTTQRVYVHSAGQVSVYINGDGGYTLEKEYEVKANGVPLPVVPVAELVLDNDGLPLEHLAYLNVKHWQSQSDQDNILKYARVPILKTVGLSSDSTIQVGSTATNLPENCDMGWVEHSGKAIGAGQESLDKLEAQMQAAGAKLLTRSKLAMTDRQTKEEAGKEVSTLRQYANQLESFAQTVLSYFALFAGVQNAGEVEISGNIDADLDASTSMDKVNEAVKQGYLSGQTAFEELQRRAMISVNLGWESEQARLEAQGLSENVDVVEE